VTAPPRLTSASLTAVAAGGAAGAVLRWSLGELLPGAPLGLTLAVNVTGCLLLAVLPVLARGRHLLTLALGPGLLGGYTTLSAYADQARSLVADGSLLLAAAYVVGTVAGCVAAAVLGEWLVRPRHLTEEEEL
jgi:CrcB protein